MAATTSVPETRALRGLALFRQRGEEIEHVKGWLWAVPSCSGEGLYLVDLKAGECECRDRPPAGEVCKHTAAATIARAKSGECAGCSKKVRHRDLYPVPEDHLTFFEGDELCLSCACAHGVA
jgi:hypothetical protein